MSSDPVVDAVCADLQRRSKVGIEKYGLTLAANPLSHREWLQHAYEEALDLANYLKRAIMDLDGWPDLTVSSRSPARPRKPQPVGARGRSA